MDLSVSSFNKQAKCELAFHLSKSDEGRKHVAKQGKSWALINGSIIHHACQTYDIDRFILKTKIDNSELGILERYLNSYKWFFSDINNLSKEKISEETASNFINNVIPAILDWWNEHEIVKASFKLNEVREYQKTLPYIFKKTK